MDLVPKKMFLTKGVGTHKHELRSFELALRDAHIEKCNLVNVSSILPPKCKIISRKQGLRYLKPGAITFAVISRATTNESRRLVSASVGVAVPANASDYGYLSELHSHGMTDEQMGDLAEDLAAAMLASTQGVDFDEDAAWDERKEVFRISNKIVRTSNITQSAIGTSLGWTTVVAAGIFIFD